MTQQEPLPPPDFEGSMARLEDLLGEVERRASPESLETVRDLVRALLEMHRPGLREMLDALATHLPADAMAALGEAPSVATLLLLHDLHPQTLDARVASALREAHDAAGHAARAEVTKIDGPRVLIRIHGDNLAGARLLRRTIDRVVLSRAPDAVLEMTGGESMAEPGLISAERLLSRGGTAAE